MTSELHRRAVRHPRRRDQRHALRRGSKLDSTPTRSWPRGHRPAFRGVRPSGHATSSGDTGWGSIRRDASPGRRWRLRARGVRPVRARNLQRRQRYRVGIHPPLRAGPRRRRRRSAPEAPASPRLGRGPRAQLLRGLEPNPRLLPPRSLRRLRRQQHLPWRRRRQSPPPVADPMAPPAAPPGPFGRAEPARPARAALDPPGPTGPRAPERDPPGVHRWRPSPAARSSCRPPSSACRTYRFVPKASARGDPAREPRGRDVGHGPRARAPAPRDP